jgi:hypothetical protein
LFYGIGKEFLGDTYMLRKIGKEKLIIKDFLSIKDFEWDIKGFNVLTGGMGSGKSLCMKLLYFCEQILHTTIFLKKSINGDSLNKQAFFEDVKEAFHSIFFSSNPGLDFNKTIIEYTYTSDKAMFDLSAKFDGNRNDLAWSSYYIEKEIGRWQSFFEKDTPDMADKARNSIYASIAHNFDESFPIGAMFIPTARTIASITDYNNFPDPFLSDFTGFIKLFALRFERFSNESINTILKIKSISYESDKKRLTIEFPDGRKIFPLYLSSGQQELLYLLPLVGHLPDTEFFYGESKSIFIEEPSAHLFPAEQKKTIEFLVNSFNALQGSARDCHFFISTHSPYALNVINNILDKSRLLKLTARIESQQEREKKQNEINALGFPALSVNDIAAYMIKDDGTVKSMIMDNDEEHYLYSDDIERITESINRDAERLLDMDNEIKSCI